MFVVLSTVYSNFPKYEIHEKIYETTWKAEKLIQLCESASDSDIETMREKWVLLKDIVFFLDENKELS